MSDGATDLTVLGELVVDLLPDPGADAGPHGTAPRYVAHPGGNALNVAVAAGRLGTPVRLLARLGTGPLVDLGVRGRREVSPQLHERVGHRSSCSGAVAGPAVRVSVVVVHHRPR